MRTTVTLDRDVEALIATAMKERQATFKQVLNAAVRAGLGSKRPRKAFVQKTFALGHDLNFRWDKALAIADAMEDEELSRKMSLRK